jgi:hypothetical protein
VLTERRGRVGAVLPLGRYERRDRCHVVHGMPAQKFDVGGIEDGGRGAPHDDVEVSSGRPAPFIEERLDRYVGDGSLFTMIGLHRDFGPMVNAAIRLGRVEQRKMRAFAQMQDAPDEIRRIIRGFDVPNSSLVAKEMADIET